jgi:hypothetical protein
MPPPLFSVFLRKKSTEWAREVKRGVCCLFLRRPYLALARRRDITGLTLFHRMTAVGASET